MAELVSNYGVWVVAAIVIAASLLNFAWLSFDGTPPHWDSANHLTSAIGYRDLLSSAVRGAAGTPVAVLTRLLHMYCGAHVAHAPRAQ